MNRSLADVLAIAQELKAVYEAYQRAAADKHVTTEEGIDLAMMALAVLAKHNVTIPELQDLLTQVGPLLALK